MEFVGQLTAALKKKLAAKPIAGLSFSGSGSTKPNLYKPGSRYHPFTSNSQAPDLLLSAARAPPLPPASSSHLAARLSHPRSELGDTRSFDPTLYSWAWPGPSDPPQKDYVAEICRLIHPKSPSIPTELPCFRNITIIILPTLFFNPASPIVCLNYVCVCVHLKRCTHTPIS